jgi:hypothetical protein
MRKLNLVVVEDGMRNCLGNDVTSVEVKDDELTFVYDNDERVDIYSLEHIDEIIIKIDR